MSDAMTATYRFQLSPAHTRELGENKIEQDDPGVSFTDISKQIPYLKELGISHVYLSPITTPVPGSTHGYNTTDYNKINEEVGGEKGLIEMANALHAQGIKVIADFVPNHMGVADGHNDWWQMLLKEGENSRYDAYFDVDWAQDADRKIMLPVLGTDVEKAIRNYIRDENGQFSKQPAEQLRYPEFMVVELQDKDGNYLKTGEGKPVYGFDYWGKDFPINEAGQKILQGQTIGTGEINHSPELIESVLAVQHYKPRHWEEGLDSLNYRRFFAINDLAGIRIENGAVFNEVHHKLKELCDNGVLDGVRIDHVDGLRDPKTYLEMLRSALGPDKYITVEKILGKGEEMPAQLRQDATTGYDMAVPLNNLFVHNIDQLKTTYDTFTESSHDFPAMEHVARLQFMVGEMPTELQRHTDTALRLAEEADQTIDPAAMKTALMQLTGAYSVYRTYINKFDPVTPTDQLIILAAAEKADSFLTSDEEKQALTFLTNALLQRPLNDSGKIKESLRGACAGFAMDYQQFTAPIVAKGTEDTAMFRYNLLRGAVEVGAELADLSLSPVDFVEFLQKRAAVTMNATSTHDTKMGEDARSRGVALSHVPEVWQEKALQWKESLKPLAKKSMSGSKAITLEDQYLLLQTLVATYPIEMLFDEGSKEQTAVYSARMQDFMTKAIREAKVNSAHVKLRVDAYSQPDADYEKSVRRFVDAIIRDKEFQPELKEFTKRVAKMGANVAISQQIIKATAPGMARLLPRFGTRKPNRG